MDPQTLELLRRLQSGPHTAPAFGQIQGLLHSVRPALLAQSDQDTLAEIGELIELWSAASSEPATGAQALLAAAEIAERDLGRRQHATQLLAQALQRDPGAMAALEARLRQSADLDAVIEAYERALDADANLDVLRRLADLYVERGDEQDAEQAADLYCTLGDALGNPEGIPWLEQALDQMPGHVEAMDLLEQFIPATEQAARLKTRWAAFTDTPSSDPSVDSRRISLARAYGTDCRYRDALLCIAPLIDKHDPTALRLREAFLANLEGEHEERGAPSQPPPADNAPARALRPRSGRTMVGFKIPSDIVEVPLMSSDGVPIPPPSATEVARISSLPSAQSVARGSRTAVTPRAAATAARVPAAASAAKISAPPSPVRSSVAMVSAASRVSSAPPSAAGSAARGSLASAARISVPAGSRSSSAPPTLSANHGRASSTAPAAVAAAGVRRAPGAAVATGAANVALVAPMQRASLSPQTSSAVRATVEPAFVASAPAVASKPIEDDELDVPKRKAGLFTRGRVLAAAALILVAGGAFGLSKRFMPASPVLPVASLQPAGSVVAPAPVPPPPAAVTPTPTEVVPPPAAAPAAAASPEVAATAVASAVAAPTEPAAIAKKEESEKPTRTGPTVRPDLKLASVHGGKLSDEQLSEVFEQGAPKLERCYAQALKKKPHTEGKLFLSWTVRPNGRVIHVEQLKTSTMHDAGLYKCTAQTIAALRFPKPGKKPAQVKLPLEYQRPHGGSAGGALARSK